MAYSHDLRERVVHAIQRGDRSQRGIAEDYEVSLSFVEEVWRRYRETGSCAIKVWRPGPRPKLSEQSQRQRLQAEVKQQPGVTLEELCERVRTEDGQKVSASVMSRTLSRLGITHKKSSSMPVSRIHNG